MKELVDGTIRVQIDIDPIHRAEFFAAFSRIDMPVALAPLVANFEQINGVHKNADLPPQTTDKPDNNAAEAACTDKPKGGELAKWAGILSNDPVFWEWLYLERCVEVRSESSAANYIRDICGVGSRAELDHNPEAAKIFRTMMGEFDDWKNGGKAA